ncbi:MULTISPECIES: hypothetical protein [Glycomyces]|uniref:DUF3618 domain-containing protein n=2 Tax=Glycomyces TaxID=58113 RepID=A0A9X3PJL2_9ACTN|nr:hypothetical protein [Glycomyces lechevalierae]MDA1386706.1 hypothetical protein [Glycomyces lechevalierae]MDR7340303.1 hypothetical protein [Glycomyces lechevalierae]
MTGMPGPTNGPFPPGVGLSPPPSVSMPYWPNVEAPSETEFKREHQDEWARQNAEADQYKSTRDLERDAEFTRGRVNDTVLELKERLGLDPDAGHAHGPFAPVRRHPLTVAVAAAGATVAAIVGVHVIRDQRRSSKAARDAARQAIKETELRRKAASKAARKRWAAAKDAFGSAATAVLKQRRKAMRRLTH